MRIPESFGRLASEAVIGMAVPLLALVGTDEVLASSAPTPLRVLAAAVLAAAAAGCGAERATGALRTLRSRIRPAVPDRTMSLVTVAGTSAVPLAVLACTAWDGASWAAARQDGAWPVGAVSAFVALGGIVATLALAFTRPSVRPTGVR